MSPSGGQADSFLAMDRQLERDGFGLIPDEEVVRLQELRNKAAQLFGECLEGRRFGCQTRDVVARRYPDTNLGIPVGVDMVDESSHEVSRIARRCGPV